MSIAILAMLFAFIVPCFSKKVTTNEQLTRVVFALLLARQMISFAQVYFHGLPMVDADPIAFHQQCATNFGPLSREPYGRFLKTFYNLFEPSHLLGCELSQIAFSICLVIFIELIYKLKLEEHAPKIVMTMALLPSSLLHTSVTLREPFQMMALLMFVLVTMDLVERGLTLTSLTLAPIAMGLLIMLHQGFGLLVLILLPLGLVAIGAKRPLAMAVALTLTVGTATLYSGQIWNFLRQHSTVIKSVDEGKALEYIDGYQESVARGRSDFDTFLDLSSLGSAIQTGPMVVLNYMFSPLPWQVGDWKDLFGFGEIIVRLILIFQLLTGLLKRQKPSAKQYYLLLCVYLLVEGMWAAGTSNWGTAFRHRVVAYPLLVLLAGFGYYKSSDPGTSLPRQALSQRDKIRASRRKNIPISSEQ